MEVVMFVRCVSGGNEAPFGSEVVDVPVLAAAQVRSQRSVTVSAVRGGRVVLLLALAARPGLTPFGASSSGECLLLSSAGSWRPPVAASRGGMR